MSHLIALISNYPSDFLNVNWVIMYKRLQHSFCTSKPWVQLSPEPKQHKLLLFDHLLKNKTADGLYSILIHLAYSSHSFQLSYCAQLQLICLHFMFISKSKDTVSSSMLIEVKLNNNKSYCSSGLAY